MTLRVSDQALVRFLERAGGLDVEQLRAAIAASLDRAEAFAAVAGVSSFQVRADGLVYVIRQGAVTTIIPDDRG